MSNNTKNSEMSRKNNYFMGQDYFNDPPEDYTDQRKQDREDDYVSLDSEGKQKSFTRLCTRFAEKTSMQGLPYINAARLWYAKLLWVLLLLGGIAGMTLHLYYLIDQYLQYNVQVTVTLGFNNLQFPAVTVCNVNAVKKNYRYNMSEKLQSFTAKTDPLQITPTPPPGGRKRRAIDEYERIDFDNYSTEFDFRPNRGTKDNSYRIQDAFETLYMKESRFVRRWAGHQLEDMLLECSFGGYECYPGNFSLIQTAKYGNCYTIQSDDFLVTNPGPEYGLSMTLYMETEEYLTGISHGYGARVQIHDRNTYPFPADEGLYVPSSFETHIGLKQVEVIRKGGLYGDCTNTSSYLDTYGAKYTRTLCQVFCEQSLVVQRCSCYDIAKSDIFISLKTSLPDKPCRNDTERSCLAQFEADRTETTLNCPQCTNPCNEDQYVKSYSSRNWPNDEYVNVLMQSVCEKLQTQKCQKVTTEKNDQYSLGQNFLKIVVYYEDLNFEKIEETPEIEVQQFASDVGGAIGLWIGLSIISVFELVQLLMECCAYGVHRCKNPRSCERKRAEKHKQSTKDTPKRQKENGHYPENSTQLNGLVFYPYNNNWRN